ncbi:unnamed protein product [Phaeothamnion confervicola]
MASSTAPIKAAATAYQLFQREISSSVAEELRHEGVKDDLISALGKKVSKRWRELKSGPRAKYERLAEADCERFRQESVARDASAIEEQKQRRAAFASDAPVDGVRRRTELQPVEERKERRMRMEEELTEGERRAKRAREQQRADAKEARLAGEAEAKRQKDQIATDKADAAGKRLRYLLRQSEIFHTHFGVGKALATDSAANGGSACGGGGASASSSGAAAAAATASPAKRRRAAAKGDDEADARDGEEGEAAQAPTFLLQQPPSLKGQLRAYQLEGLNWMINLQEQGVNGILADEMGLGKTLQSISILTHCLDHSGVRGPHIILVPKSTLSNWMNEFARFSPRLRPVRLQGTKEERAAVIADVLKPGSRPEERAWDVCLTTYEVANMEKNTLQKFGWRYLIIDEAHRLKNESSLFSQTVRGLQTQHRLLLTGTPLQNNLHELWALLNFLLPDVFSDADQFNEFFNLDVEDNDVKQNMISQLHKVLRPFMLRRLKADVEKSLPPKAETILFTGMSAKQKELYRQVLMRDMGTVNGGAGVQRTAVLNIVMQLRKCCNHPYLFPGVEDRALPPLGEHLIENCGKMVLLDKLLRKLHQLGHRVLVFSQMTRVLDILEDFMHMRGYRYCRIDGDTSYEAREDLIDAYNKAGSSKFVFLLSTRAGGLGINLQTADTVILYDSDWNPQADLQAQDRCHRIGQTKPVQIYRLVTEDTIEEKVVERAQQKLKLDAMVVQQGRLQADEKSSKLSKDELLEALRFGADQVFRSKDATITDEDIDAILARGAARTEELNAKLQKADKGDLLDFKLDGGTGVQQFEGVDYKDKSVRDLMRLNFVDMGKRERKPVANYTVKPSPAAGTGSGAGDKSKGGLKLPREVDMPKVREWQLFNMTRLHAIHNCALDAYRELKEAEAKDGGAPVPETMAELEAALFSPEDLAEKRLLLSQGFPSWKKSHMRVYVDSCNRHSRKNLSAVAADVGKPEDEVRRYHEAFWARGGECLPLAEWERLTKNIERGERRLEDVGRMSAATAELLRVYEDPWNQLEFRFAPPVTKGFFTAEEDRYLLCFVHRLGYGNWAEIREAMLAAPRLRFDYFVRSLELTTIQQRCDQLMKAAEKEMQERATRSEPVDTPASSASAESRAAPVITDPAESAARIRALQETLELLKQVVAGLPSPDSVEVLPGPPDSSGAYGGRYDGSYGFRDDDEDDSDADSLTGRRSPAPRAKPRRKPGGTGGPGGSAAGAQHRQKKIPPELLPELARIVQDGGPAGMQVLVEQFRSVHPAYTKVATAEAIKAMAVKEARVGVVRGKCWFVRSTELLEQPVHDGKLPEEIEYDRWLASVTRVAGAASKVGGGGCDNSDGGGEDGDGDRDGATAGSGNADGNGDRDGAAVGSGDTDGDGADAGNSSGEDGGESGKANGSGSGGAKRKPDSERPAEPAPKRAKTADGGGGGAVGSSDGCETAGGCEDSAWESASGMAAAVSPRSSGGSGGDNRKDRQPMDSSLA